MRAVPPVAKRETPPVIKSGFGVASIVFYTVIAGGTPVQKLPLERAIALAKEKSPEIRAAQNQLASAEAKSKLVFGLAEPTFQVQYNDMETPFRIGTHASTVYQIGQVLQFPGKAFLARAAAKNSARAVGAQLRSIELQVAASVRNSYNQLSLAQLSLQLNEDQRAAYERILAVAKRRYESAAIPQVDLLNAQIALYANDNDLSDLKAAESAARAQLNVVIEQPVKAELYTEPITVDPRELPSYEQAEAKMEQERAELKAARFQLKAAEYAYDSARLSWLPDFQLIAGMSHYNEITASPWANRPERAVAQDTYMAGAQITVPLWFLFNERHVISGASRDRATADANFRTVANQSKIALQSTLENLRALATRVENFEKHLLPLSEQALSLALVSYSAGKIDFQTLVDTATARRNARRDSLSAKANFVSNLSTLGQLMGEEI